MSADTSKTALINQFVEENALPKAFGAVAREYYLPLAERIAVAIAENKIRVLGISGGQGSGKTTLAVFIAQYLSSARGLNVVQLSLDDFYLIRDERVQLADDVHPLLAVRGVPGTHDVKLAIDTLERLIEQRGQASVRVPRFDKAIDDRVPESDFEVVNDQVDLVVFEGWCVGVPAQLPTDLEIPFNDLERTEDLEGVWRQYVNQALASDYQVLFGLIDYLVWLKVPGFDSVYRWRAEQERKLRESAGSGDRVMTDEQLNRFIQHYERITRHGMETLGNKADAIIALNEDHGIDSLIYPEKPGSLGD